MSQGNDAFTPKDADPAVNADASAPAEREQADRKKTESSPSAEVEAQSSSSNVKRSSGAPKPAKSTEAEDPSDLDASDADAEEPAVERSPKPKSQKERRRRSRDEEDDEERLQPPETEEEINVPKMQTVYMLAAMSALTVVLWFAAKLTCNVHPDQVRDPKHFSTKDLAADPKNAAFEFHQRYEMADFVTAYDLATAEMKQTIEGKLKDCEQHADDCAKNQRELEGTVQSSVKLLDRSENRATVEMTSYYKSTAAPRTTPKTFSLTVVKEGEFWRVASRREIQAAPQVAEPVSASPAAPVEMAPNNAAPNAPVEQSAPAQ